MPGYSTRPQWLGKHVIVEQVLDPFLFHGLWLSRHRRSIQQAWEMMNQAASKREARPRISIPGDISVVGFDDVCYSRILDPPLTTIRQPAAEIGERVMHRLLREIEEGRSQTAKTEIVPHELIIRQSVAPPAPVARTVAVKPGSA